MGKAFEYIYLIEKDWEDPKPVNYSYIDPIKAKELFIKAGVKNDPAISKKQKEEESGS